MHKHLSCITLAALTGLMATAASPAGAPRLRLADAPRESVVRAATSGVSFTDPAPVKVKPSETEGVRYASRHRGSACAVPAAAPARAPHALAALNGLHMNITYSSAWPEGKIRSGIYAMPLGGGDMTLMTPEEYFGATFLIGNYGACYIDNQYSYITTFSGDVGEDQYDNVTYLLSTFNWQPMGTVGEYQTRDGLTPFSMAYDPVTGADFYATFFNESGEGYHFGMLKIGAQAPGSTVIREVTGTADCPAALAFDSKGNLYCINLDGDFCSMDKTTGEVSKLFSTGVFQTTSFGMAYNSADGCFYTLDQVAEPDKANLAASVSRIVRIDPAARTAEAVAQFDGYIEASGFYIDQLPAKAGAPVATTDLVADFKNTLAGELAFTAPESAVDGSALSGDLEYEVYENGKLFDKGTIKPGEPYTHAISAPEDGYMSYDVLFFNAEGAGKLASVTVWAGVYIPQPARIRNFDAVENPDKPGEMTLTWDAISADADGNPIDASAYWYVVKAYVDGSDRLSVIADHVTGTSYTYQAVTTGQQFVTYVVMPASAMGEYDRASSMSNDLCIGEPFLMPWREDFEDMAAVNMDWLFNGSDCKFSSTVNGIAPENGSAYLGISATWNAAAPAHAEAYTGKISLKGTEKPTLSFKYYSIPNQANMILLLVMVNGDGNMIGFIDTSEGSEAGWRTVTYPLESFKGKEIQLAFIMDAAMITSYMALDDIKISDPMAQNIEIGEVAAPETLTAGIPFKLTVPFSNIGLRDIAAGAYTVSCAANGKTVATVDGPAIAADSSDKVELTVTPDNTWQETNVLSVTVDYDADMDPADNSFILSGVRCEFPSYPAPLNLTGERTASEVSLAWEAPAAPEEAEVFESFETLAPYTITDFGKWKVIDGDGEPTYGIQSAAGSLYFPNNGLPHAFIVFPNSLFNFQWSASGEQFLASIVNYVNDVPDDWLISPLLSGSAQTISFYSKVMFDTYPAKIEVLASSTDTERESFTLVETFDVIATSWDAFMSDLPEGTKYFAIHVIENAYLLMIDDVFYTPAVPDLKLQGYNVYCDGEKVNAEPLQGLTHTMAADADHTYNVSAVYDLGESPLSDPVKPAYSSLDENFAAGCAVSVNGHEIIVTGAEGRHVSVCGVDGLVLRSAEGSARTAIRVEPGIYLVKAGSTVAKVLVK